MTPKYNSENRCFTVSYVMLDEKKVGDYFSCQLEIEFKDVKESENKQFAFYTQGAVDDTWSKENIWNSNFVNLSEAPEDGEYKYIVTSQITAKNADGEKFDIGFRCDNWANGSFRVRKIKIEKRIIASKWTESLVK